MSPPDLVSSLSPDRVQTACLGGGDIDIGVATTGVHLPTLPWSPLATVCTCPVAVVSGQCAAQHNYLMTLSCLLRVFSTIIH